MTIVPLPYESQAKSGFTHKINITHADLTAAATTETIELLTAPAGGVVRKVAFRVNTAFDGGVTSTMTLQVGDGVDPNRYVTAQVVHVDGTEILSWIESNATDSAPYSYVAADTVDALFTATGANVSVLTAGDMDIYVQIFDLDDLG